MPEVDPAPGVALARKREDCVRSDVHMSVDSTGEMHAEERKLRIRDGIHQPAHEIGTVRYECSVLAPERDHAQAVGPIGTADGLGHLVGVEARTRDDALRLESLACRLDDQA